MSLYEFFEPYYKIYAMRKTGLLLMLLMLFAGWVGAQQKQPAPNADSEGTLVKIGQTVPDFEVKMFDGSTIDIRQLKGKVVLLNFWATWCGPCRMEFTRVQKDIIDRFKGKDFIFLPISREDSYEKIKEFRKKMGYTFPMGMDLDRKIYSKFASASIPRNFIIDRKGKIIFAETGYNEESFNKMIEKLEALLK